MTPTPGNVYDFDRFRLDAAERVLLRDGREVPLTQKAFDVLLALVERSGRVVGKEELMQRVWPEQFVEDSNLTQNVYTLRKILAEGGDDREYIQTVPRRGYRFTVEVRGGASGGGRGTGEQVAPSEAASEVAAGDSAGGGTGAGVRAEESAVTTPEGSMSAGPTGADSEEGPEAFASPDTLAFESPDAFVGRSAELARLGALLERAVAGSGRIVFISGEPGLGKTALANEFVRRASRTHPGTLFARGRCVEQYGASEAYLPILEAFGGLLHGARRVLIERMLLAFAPTWCLQLPAAFAAPEVRERLRREALGATRERMLREMGECLAELSSRAPVVLLLEDLHWADPSSIDLLRHLSHRVARRRLLVVGTYRPDDAEVANQPFQVCKREMDAHDQCEEVALGALGHEHLAAYLDAQFAPNDFTENLADLILQKTGGHPLFATRLAQYLAERGDVSNTSGVWTLARDLSAVDLEMPESVLSMIRRRIEGLDEEDRRALRHASVQGDEFLSTVLAGSLGADPVEVEERLDRLARAHRLIRSRGEEDLPDGSLSTRYSFSHALYQNVLYGDLVSQRRRQLHATGGDLLERHYADESPRVAAQLAVHFERGRDFARAVRYHAIVGDNAARLHATAEAAAHYARALELAEKLPADERAEALVSLHLKRGAVETARSRFDSAHDDFARVVALARERGDAEVELAALNGLIKVLFFARRMDEVALRTDEALALAERTGNEALRLEALAFVVQRLMRAREWPEAVALAERIVREAESLGHRPALLSGLVERGELHFQQCEYALADETLTRAVALASEMGDGFMRLYALFLLGLVATNSGRMSRALEHLGEAERLAERNGDRFWLARLPSTVGWIHRELQDFDRALDYDRRGLEIARADSLPEVEANALINFCQESARQGDAAGWESAFREIESIIERHPWMRPRYHIRLQSVMAEYWLAVKDYERADDHARLFVELTTKHEMHKDAAVARLLLAEAAAARGLREEAAAQLETSLALTIKYHAPLVAWRVHAALGRLHALAGDAPASRAAYAEARRVVETIAEGVSDETLRAAFLASPAVREVLEGAG
jgi:DNA-binding winged helix-turn-helix (wHTH) protein/tetratricopeptide (TPR) repeat protein